jgi:hypothetical protein
VLRTDRYMPMFSDPEGYGLKKLRNILMTYMIYNSDIGYVQGMNDLLSPIVLVIEDEADAFWCFVELMKTMQLNFHHNQKGMHRRLTSLAHLVAIMDSALFKKIGK